MGAELAVAPNQEPANQRTPVLLQVLQPVNLLSFGPDTPEIPLGPLNVLIGPNGSGKSNLIETVALLRSSATDMAETVRRGGGIGEWIWKGDPKGIASLTTLVANPEGELPLRH